ncbi:uncharacterized protein LOC122922225 isoform X1 [Bufo gargarizans]|uniref:uncharacterized protein LOC122922225 isoform X1 n=1 Tax=Bufo gargarizans TaxID=30331 RepID=UPI001CF48870|nr:uncharacterized protein LOC122922225 isoform X1 [Bufo gargarizans]
MFCYCTAILLLIFQKCVFCYKPCGEVKNVSAVEGENVILQVDEEMITEISWVFGNKHIATTQPNKTIDIKSWDYRSKLYTEGNVSLGIVKINTEQSGTFVASIFKEKGECSQEYHLTVYSTEKGGMVAIVTLMCVVLIVLVTFCTCCLKNKKMRTMRCSSCGRKPITAPFTGNIQKENVYYEILLKGNPPNMTVNHENKDVIERRETVVNTIYATATNPSMVPVDN